MGLLPLPAVLLLGALLTGAAPMASAGDGVTIYRCIDARGRLTLRDTPCAKGERQEARTMMRPKDAPPRPRELAAPPSAVVPAQVPTVVMAYPPRPLYECTTPDGERYTSETSEGNPRWVPLWTLGYPAVSVHPRGDAGFDFRIGNRHVGISGGSHATTDGVLPVTPAPLYPVAMGPGSWIRDACYALPQAEVCDRIRDRRAEVRRRFFNAQPSERDVLRVEERGLDARLDSDCGGR